VAVLGFLSAGNRMSIHTFTVRRNKNRMNDFLQLGLLPDSPAHPSDPQGKLNCWEFKKCGREPGGTNTSHAGTCPAAVEARADGIHSGMNGGRCCWAVTAALRQQGICLDQSGGGCDDCDFYRLVRNEEEQRLVLRHIRPAALRRSKIF
jgi:hypothetical protein